MKNRSIMLSALAFVIFPWLMAENGLAESEVPLFQDEFDTAALLIEHFKPDSAANWKVEDGILVGDHGGNIKANFHLDPNSKVVTDVALIPDSVEEGGFAGINIGGCLFALRSDGFWSVYHEKGEKRARGSFTKKKIEPGKFYRMEVSRRSIGGGFAYTWEVDGEQMPEFTQMNSKDNEDPGDFSLKAWRTGAHYDSVTAYRLEDGVVSNNTLRNSSFEYLQDGLPLYWMPGVSIDDLVGSYKNHENYWKTVQIDPTISHSGKQSLRIEVNDKVPLNGFKSFDADINKSEPFTYSVWLKANRENVPATLIIREKWGKHHAKEIVIGTEWNKYSFSLPNAEKGQIWTGLRFSTPAVIWADTAQLEAGDATGDYQASTADTRIGQREEDKVVQYYMVPLGKPTLNEDTGKGWPDALILDDFRIVNTDAIPNQKTSAQILSDKENLYIRFSCFEKGMNALQSRDENALGKISSGDCVEVFLDVTGEKRKFYHLFINPDGGKLSMDQQRRLGWNPDWKVQTYKHPDRWDVKIKIPFKSLEGAQTQWGINLARHEPRANENSCTSRVGPKFFSDAARYDQFTFPAAANLQSTEKAEAKSVGEKSVYTDHNYYMNESKAVIIASNVPSAGEATLRVVTESGKVIWSNTVKTKPGKNRFSIPLKNVDNGTYDIDVKIGKDINSRVLLVKRPFREDAVQVNQEQRCLLVNGKPYFIFAPFFVVRTGPPSQATNLALENAENTISYLADAGMKTISMLIELKDETGGNPAFVERLLDYCDQKQLKVILWIKETANLAPVAAKVGEHSAVLAWKLWDEPELYAKEEDVARSNEEFRMQIPYRPLIMNNTVVGIPSRYAGLNVDIISHDDYVTNKPDRKVQEILDNLTNLEDASRELRKPALIFLTGANFQNHYRESTAGELIAQTYGAVIKGIAGTWYFFGIPVGKKSWATYKQTNKEILSLTDVLFSNEEAPEILSVETAILATTRRHEGKLYLITTNIENRPVSATFKLPEEINNNKAEVLFEDRKVNIQAGTLQDNYEPHSRRVYVFDAPE